MTFDEYKAAMGSITDPKEYLQVVSVEIGVLARSTGKIGSDSNVNTQKVFKLAGQTVTLSGTDATNQKYLRQAVNQMVALRNTLGHHDKKAAGCNTHCCSYYFNYGDFVRYSCN